MAEDGQVTQRRIYRVRPEPLREIDDWLQPYRALWSTRLDELEEHLRTMDSDEAKQPRRRRRHGQRGEN